MNDFAVDDVFFPDTAVPDDALIPLLAAVPEDTLTVDEAAVDEGFLLDTTAPLEDGLLDEETEAVGKAAATATRPSRAKLTFILRDSYSLSVLGLLLG